MLETVLAEYGGIEVSAMTVYRDMFHLGENYIQKENEPSGQFKGNPLGYKKADGADKGNYRILFEDTFEEVLKELQEADFAILNGISYYGRKNVQENACKMYALILDVDGVSESGLKNFLYGAYNGVDMYPVPNYVVLSGHGIHVYYLFEEPVSLYPNVKLQLKELKYALTRKIWNRNVTELYDRIQYQGINQGFRVIGGKSKIDGVKVRAFRLNRHPFNLEQLNRFVDQKYQVDVSKRWRGSRMTLQAAMEKYPEWYERRVVNGEDKRTWVCHEGLYKWWLNEIKAGAVFGHRYFCIMALAIYAAKCDVTREQLEKDAKGLISFLSDLNVSDPFTEDDVQAALECYDIRYKYFPREDISKLTAIEILPNKRNGRKQRDHVRIMNFVREEINGNKDWRNKDGRPTAERIVLDWQKEHPNGRCADCIRDTGLSRPTVYKWFKKQLKQGDF